MAEQTSFPQVGPAQISVALLIGSLALVVLGLQPILLGALIDAHRITMSGIGLIAMGEIMAVGIGVASSDAALPVLRYRLIAVIAAVLVAGIDLATPYFEGDAALALLRCVAGFAEGVLVWVATCTIVRAREPDRAAAVFVVVQTVIQAVAAALFAGVVVPHAGWRGAFVALATLLVLCALLAAELAPDLAPLAKEADGKVIWTIGRVLPLAIAFLQMAGLGAIWAYLEPLGRSAGLSAEEAQALVSGVLLVQVTGGLAAIMLVRRLDVVTTVCAGALVLTAVTAGLYFLPHNAAGRFVVLCAALAFVWLFLNPFQFGLTFRADGEGRVAVLVPAAQLLGLAFGPFMASLAVGNDNVRAAALVGSCCTLASLALVWGGRKYWLRAQLAPDEVMQGDVT